MQGTYAHLLSTFDGQYRRKKPLKQLPSIGEKSRESVILLSKYKSKRFCVYLDEEVGMMSKYQNDLH